MWCRTEQQLYLFYDRLIPRSFVTTLDRFDGLQSALGPVILADPFADDVHAQAHGWCGNRCRGVRTTKSLRFPSQIGVLGRVIREIGCLDTPLLDVDRANIVDGRLVGIAELKRSGERADAAQMQVLRKLSVVMSVEGRTGISLPASHS